MCLAAALSCQLALIFVESKEEEELSLMRKHRMGEVKAAIEEDQALTARIQREIDSGDPDVAAKWAKFRRRKMQNTIYVSKAFGESLKLRPDPERQRIEEMIDSLAGDGWKNSEIARPDDSPGGGLRAHRSGNLSLIFRYAPEQNAIIVANVMPSADYELAMGA